MVGPTPQAKLSKAFSIGKLFLHAQRCFSLTQGQDSSRKHQKATPDCQFIAFRNCRMAPWARPSDPPLPFSLERAKASPATPKATPDWDSRFIAFRNCRMALCARPSDSAASFQALRFDPLLPSFPSNVRKLARQHQKARQTASRQHQKPRQTVNVFQNCWMAPCARPSDSPRLPRFPRTCKSQPRNTKSHASHARLPRFPWTCDSQPHPPDCQFIAFWNCRMAPCAKPSH